ncbi:hypothetical protein JY651_42005 [Pyxidicoccus parkwayensis]|uniref:Secreted protein n=1 Tax=Pyxidicoccus parkwayensis TaxID=2813578 RepID=A0ABX7P026_9BACT|nr:hypothetical protein [Pyxidicoccus parkwaysis]QSQ21668.1 hypothetical protein JY651_42005 [Pyxidicoccus parkwaysis]
MLNRDDRRDLACLGLMVLVYGLAVAPVVHAVVGHGGGGARHVHVHARGEQAHSHGPERDVPDGHAPGKGHGPGGHQHLTGSVEHLHAVAASWAVVDAPRVPVLSWVAEVLRGPSRAPGAAPRLTAMPQGP